MQERYRLDESHLGVRKTALHTSLNTAGPSSFRTFVDVRKKYGLKVVSESARTIIAGGDIDLERRFRDRILDLLILAKSDKHKV